MWLFLLFKPNSNVLHIHNSKSKEQQILTGSCSDIDERIKRHNEGATPSTKTGRPWKLVYSESYETNSDALKREREIKSKKSRKYIEYLISSKSLL